ncbi:MAG: hypothetical protein PHY29_12245, partial [Syntrophales bacterium]|nr:hypothetical protein [Syntrophales bacterium]
ESVGDWYLLVRFTTPEGTNLEGVTYRPTGKGGVAKHPRKQPSTGRIESGQGKIYQIVEGFSTAVSYGHTQENYPDVRGGAEGWWEYHREGGEVSWDTAVCAKKRDTVFVFWGQTGEDPGKAELRVNNIRAITFDTGIQENGEWSGDGMTLVALFRGISAGNCALYFLKVPKNAVVAGEPCQIEVRHISGGQGSWFMIKNYKDNIIREAVTESKLPPSIRGEVR